MFNPVKLKLPDLYLNEFSRYESIVKNKDRTTTGNVVFTSTSSGITYNTASTDYNNQGESGLALLLYNTSPILNNYIYDDKTYEIYMKESLFTNVTDTKLNYTDGVLTSVEEKIWLSMYKLSVLNYSSGVLTTVDVTVYDNDGVTILYQYSQTLNYIDGVLDLIENEVI